MMAKQKLAPQNPPVAAIEMTLLPGWPLTVGWRLLRVRISPNVAVRLCGSQIGHEVNNDTDCAANAGRQE